MSSLRLAPTPKQLRYASFLARTWATEPTKARIIRGEVSRKECSELIKLMLKRKRGEDPTWCDKARARAHTVSLERYMETAPEFNHPIVLRETDMKWVRDKLNEGKDAFTKEEFRSFCEQDQNIDLDQRKMANMRVCWEHFVHPKEGSDYACGIQEYEAYKKGEMKREECICTNPDTYKPPEHYYDQFTAMTTEEVIAVVMKKNEQLGLCSGLFSKLEKLPTNLTHWQLRHFRRFGIATYVENGILARKKIKLYETAEFRRRVCEGLDKEGFRALKENELVFVEWLYYRFMTICALDKRC